MTEPGAAQSVDTARCLISHPPAVGHQQVAVAAAMVQPDVGDDGEVGPDPRLAGPQLGEQHVGDVVAHNRFDADAAGDTAQEGRDRRSAAQRLEAPDFEDPVAAEGLREVVDPARVAGPVVARQGVSDLLAGDQLPHFHRRDSSLSIPNSVSARAGARCGEAGRHRLDRDAMTSILMHSKGIGGRPAGIGVRLWCRLLLADVLRRRRLAITGVDTYDTEGGRMSDKSGPEEAIEGVVEGVKGKVKEVAGAVAGRDDLMREGQAQQDKAEAQREAAQKEAEAESARKAAEINEARQKAEQ